MSTWAELLAGRTQMPKRRNSVHMMQCRAAVLAAKSNAKIVPFENEDKSRVWVLKDGAESLSRPHNSEYACWAEASEILKELK